MIWNGRKLQFLCKLQVCPISQSTNFVAVPNVILPICRQKEAHPPILPTIGVISTGMATYNPYNSSDPNVERPPDDSPELNFPRNILMTLFAI